MQSSTFLFSHAEEDPHYYHKNLLPLQRVGPLPAVQDELHATTRLTLLTLYHRITSIWTKTWQRIETCITEKLEKFIHIYYNFVSSQFIHEIKYNLNNKYAA